MLGRAADVTVTRWDTVHGDLHWNNLMCPRFGLLDWGLWGTGPAGTDLAALHCYSLLTPSTVVPAWKTFADMLDTPHGRVAQRYVVTRLLR